MTHRSASSTREHEAIPRGAPTASRLRPATQPPRTRTHARSLAEHGSRVLEQARTGLGPKPGASPARLLRTGSAVAPLHAPRRLPPRPQLRLHLPDAPRHAGAVRGRLHGAGAAAAAVHPPLAGHGAARCLSCHSCCTATSDTACSAQALQAPRAGLEPTRHARVRVCACACACACACRLQVLITGGAALVGAASVLASACRGGGCGPDPLPPSPPAGLTAPPPSDVGPGGLTALGLGARRLLVGGGAGRALGRVVAAHDSCLCVTLRSCADALVHPHFHAPLPHPRPTSSPPHPPRPWPSRARRWTRRPRRCWATCAWWRRRQGQDTGANAFYSSCCPWALSQSLRLLPYHRYALVEAKHSQCTRHSKGNHAMSMSHRSTQCLFSSWQAFTALQFVLEEWFVATYKVTIRAGQADAGRMQGPGAGRPPALRAWPLRWRPGAGHRESEQGTRTTRPANQHSSKLFSRALPPPPSPASGAYAAGGGAGGRVGLRPDGADAPPGPGAAIRAAGPADALRRSGPGAPLPLGRSPRPRPHRCNLAQPWHVACQRHATGVFPALLTAASDARPFMHAP
jgi:hypothetical protein